MTYFCSAAVSMILSHYLSIPLNFLDSVGIYFAISPKVKTDTRLVQRVWTLSHFSTISATSERRAIVSVTMDLNGVTYLMAFI